MNWQLISQLLSYAVAIISALVSLFNNRKNNKTVKEIELTKQKFAQENEQLKRNQAAKDHKNKLITNFLGSINSYQATHTTDARREALRACGEVMSICNNDQKDLVNKVIDAINKMPDYPAYSGIPQSVWDNTTKIISEATNNFVKLAQEQDK